MFIGILKISSNGLELLGGRFFLPINIMGIFIELKEILFFTLVSIIIALYFLSIFSRDFSSIMKILKVKNDFNS